jgi:hypothetical protein
MILITSGAYVSSGLIAEFGRLPPSMLPLQNRRLYQHQLGLFKEEPAFLSLPIDYELSEYDRKKLEELNVNIVLIPLGISLGESVVYALNLIGHYAEPLRLLHGDTLIDSVPESYDCCLYSNAEDEYNWDYIENNKNEVYIGYYAFSNQGILIRKIIESAYHFEEGIRAYDKARKLTYVFTNSWLDFGLVSSYHRSKTKFTTQRAFNDLVITKYSVTKYSQQIKKINAEINWFTNVPYKIKRFVPSIWNHGISPDGKGFYEIEYFYFSSLAELFVFGNISLISWKRILAVCSEYLEEVTKNEIVDKYNLIDQIHLSYHEKTIKRLDTFISESGVDINHTWILNNQTVPSIADILLDINKDILPISIDDIGVLHGDFCFSNILYNHITQSIKIIDPRGLDFNDNQMIYGDIRYDIAKLAHSILGLYDFIIGGNYFLEKYDMYSLSFKIYSNSLISDIQCYFREMKFMNKSIRELSIYPIMIHLFLSMLPLHKDSPLRQKAMLANVLRLYIEYKEGFI